ncbi:hypothetical protein vBAfQDWS535_49 [Alcaligenes phage vB_Af_QDWS535]|nr:hypothetical protein vBAfQDWS535_49 [Alcaligenes phage vB_Af_QDWS535]
MKMEIPFELESLVLQGVKVLFPDITHPIIEIDNLGDKVSVYHQAWLREQTETEVRIERGLSYLGNASVKAALAAGKGH